jgi:hypothetical protein
MKKSVLTLLAGALLGTSAMAVQVMPASYSMANGVAGVFTYFDDSYNGTGCVTCAGAALSGGLGDLTDGVAATSNWFVSSGPWVGWSSNQTITFQFASTVSIDSVTFRFDDSNGNGSVAVPASVVVLGTTYSVTDPAGSPPIDFTVTGLNFVGTTLPVTINARGANWMMLSEVTFLSAVPELGTTRTMLLGLAVLGVAASLRVRRRC